MNIRNLILEEALKDLGTREVKGNQGWKPRFTLSDLTDEDKTYTQEELKPLRSKAMKEQVRVQKFEKNMVTIGWQPGQAWCLYWAELVWLRAYHRYNSFIASKLKDLIKASATATWKTFKEDSEACNFVVDQTPEKGAIAIWQKFDKGKADWRGHGAIVYGFDMERNVVKTIDGNSNASGGREGIEVAKIEREMNFDDDDGLVLLGFIHPID